MGSEGSRTSAQGGFSLTTTPLRQGLPTPLAERRVLRGMWH